MPLEIGSYFYPLTTKCRSRSERALSMRHGVVDETVLQTQAGKLFEGHDQPRQYCLGSIETMRWDDANVKDMATQLELANDFGIDFFVFDTYLGRKRGQFREEMVEPLNKAFLKLNEARSLKFATMLVFGSPRVILPVPPVKGFEEPDRYYDTDRLSIKYIVDYCAHHYWNNPLYFQLNGRPYISIFTSDLSLKGQSKDAVFASIVGNIKEYAIKQYKVEPYVVGVVRKTSAAEMMERAGVDALTGYAFLADFGDGAESIQDYPKLVDKRINEWETLSRTVGVPFVPPAVTGWDASPRGLSGYDLESVHGCYPYTPVVTNSNAREFERMLKESISFTKGHVGLSDQYGLITAWNEITEGASLLPRIIDGNIDFSYLQSVKRVRSEIG